MSDSITLDPKLLLDILQYDGRTGELFWLMRPIHLFVDTPARSAEHSCHMWNAQHAGQRAFTSIDSGGYKSGRIFNKTYRAHRVAWALVTGEWPIEHIDHINGNRSDCSWLNLRSATRPQNGQNVRSRDGGSSEYLGVSWHSRGKWHARIKANGRSRHIGYFADEIEAALAYDVEARKHFGQFAKPNFPEAFADPVKGGAVIVEVRV